MNSTQASTQSGNRILPKAGAGVSPDAPAPLERDHGAEREEREPLPVVPVARRGAQDPEHRERHRREPPAQGSRGPVEQRREREAHDQGLEEPERIRDRVQEELAGDVRDADLAEKVVGEVRR